MLETGFSVNTLESVLKKIENKQPLTLITAIETYVDIQISKRNLPQFFLFGKKIFTISVQAIFILKLRPSVHKLAQL